MGAGLIPEEAEGSPRSLKGGSNPGGLAGGGDLVSSLCRPGGAMVPGSRSQGKKVRVSFTEGTVAPAGSHPELLLYPPPGAVSGLPCASPHFHNSPERQVQL